MDWNLNMVGVLECAFALGGVGVFLIGCLHMVCCEVGKVSDWGWGW